MNVILQWTYQIFPRLAHTPTLGRACSWSPWPGRAWQCWGGWPASSPPPHDTPWQGCHHPTVTCQWSLLQPTTVFVSKSGPTYIFMFIQESEKNTRRKLTNWRYSLPFFLTSFIEKYFDPTITKTLLTSVLVMRCLASFTTAKFPRPMVSWIS